MPSATEPNLVGRLDDGGRVAATVVLAGAVAWRCLTVQVPQRVFDVDPMLALLPQAGVGPGFGLLLDASIILVAALTLLLDHLRGRFIEWRVLWAALLPAAVILWHGAGSVGDLSRGVTWIAAMLGAVALAHLSRAPALRRIALGLLLALAAPMVIRGGVQLIVEHPATVAHYQSMRDVFLADRGWAPDSPAARTYERRLLQLEATGWFGLSNVFSSLLGASAVALVMGLRRRDFVGPTSGIGLLVGLAGAGAATIAVVNGSKGAVGAMVIGAALAGCAMLPLHWRTIATANAGRLIVALVGAALLTIIARGLLLPESFADERSLLFRWHYLQNAARIIPADGLMGVGPDGFQDAYVAVRDAKHVEEVTNAHSALLDWIAALGVLGWAWVILALMALRHAGSSVRRVADGPPDGKSDDATAGGRGYSLHPALAARSGRIVAFSALAIGGASMLVELPTLDGASVLMRFAGVGAWTVLGASLAAHGIGHFARIDAARAWALLGAVTVLAVHAQIEMTMWLFGSVGWIAAFVGVVAAVDPAKRSRSTTVTPFTLAAVIAAIFFAAVVAIMGVGVVRADRAMVDAAEPLHRLGIAREAVRLVSIQGLREPSVNLTRRLVEAGIPDPTITAVVPRLFDVEPEQRSVGMRTALEALREREIDVRAATAWELEHAPAHRGDARSLVAASDQWLRRAMLTAPSTRIDSLRRAVAAAELAVERSPALTHRRRLAEATEAVARTKPSHDAWTTAALAWRDVVRRDPHGLDGLLRFADAAWAAGDAVEAERAWLHALSVDEALALDPLRQLTPERRAAVLTRLASIRPPAVESPPESDGADPADADAADGDDAAPADGPPDRTSPEEPEGYLAGEIDLQP